ncbi:MAG: FAD-dependent oxidoreductase [Bacteroidia bacterium]|nr:FAD-dependent oxidoreductase [Bacteroidia bacterium]
MSDFTRPSNLDEFAENFAQIKPLMDANMAYYESSRCLFCYDAPCIQACPTGIDIPLFIKQINTNNLTGAARTIYSANYFGHTCGKVCPTEVLCEGACVYNEQDVKPIEIGRLQSHATTIAIKSDKKLFNVAQPNGKKVAVIGAGPAGISCACELSQLGFSVKIFEAKSKPSGLALHGTAPYKITNQEVLDEVDYLKTQFGFEIQYDTRIKGDRFEELEKQFDAIFLGIGLGDTRFTNTSGEELENSVGATEFIEKLKLDPLSVEVGKKVVVIGGGNTAMDGASECARLGADVTLLYRRSKAEMGAYEFEYDLIRSAGAKAMFNISVKEIMGADKVVRVRCVKTQNSNGKLEEIPGSEFSLACDLLIRATGQKKQTSLLDSVGLGFDKKGKIEVDPVNYQCSKKQYFAGGDAVNGGAEVVNACYEGKKAALGIHEYLSK